MTISISPVLVAARTDHRQLSGDAVFVPLYEGGVLPKWLSPATLWKSGFTGAKGEMHTEWSEDGDRRYVFLGLGKPLDPADPFSGEATRSAAGLVAKTAKKLKVKDAAILFVESPMSSFFDVCLGLLLGEHEFSRKGKPASSWECQFKVSLPLSIDDLEVSRQLKWIEIAVEVAKAIITTRELVSDGGNNVDPGTMCDTAMRLMNERVACRVYYAPELREMGAGLLLAVGQGSEDTPKKGPCLIHMTYRPIVPCENSTPDIWIIGKGVTFDSGGLDLKVVPGSIRHMRIDMAGAAACIGIMQALGALLPLSTVVHCVMPVTENMTGPGAYKPGDIHKSMSGKTVEIGNTDAEGRLILADAMTFAQNKGAQVIITLATLTGAQMVALGPIAALYANQKAEDLGLVRNMRLAASESADRVHAMPLDPRLKPMLRSKGGADIGNFTGVPYVGSGTAALFLEDFVNDGVAFMHLDISGVAYQWIPLGLHHQQEELATGFGVGLMLSFLSALVEK